jgi:uncharacterized membrane protein YqaE (UPF0057 family)
MKNVILMTVLIVTASFLLSSCSIFFSTSLMKSNEFNALSVGPGADNISEPIEEDINTYQVKGYSSVQTEREDVKDTLLDNIMVPAQPPLGAINVSNNKDEQNEAVFTDYNYVVKGVKGNPKTEMNNYQNKPDIVQPVNYSNSSKPSSNGVPYWLIVILAIFIPPLAVAIAYGIVDKFWICLLLTFCFFIPGMIYALIQVLK